MFVVVDYFEWFADETLYSIGRRVYGAVANTANVNARTVMYQLYIYLLLIILNGFNLALGILNPVRLG